MNHFVTVAPTLIGKERDLETPSWFPLPRVEEHGTGTPCLDELQGSFLLRYSFNGRRRDWAGVAGRRWGVLARISAYPVVANILLMMELRHHRSLYGIQITLG